MATKGATYKCYTCGNIVKVLEAGDGTLVCCSVPMRLEAEPEDEENFEK